MSRYLEMIKRLDARAVFWGMSIVFLFQLLWACDYGKMKEDEAIHTYRATMPEMPSKTIPTNGGIQTLRETDPDELVNPIAYSEESVQHGKEAYGYYCIQCHGPHADGLGTVGQSFAPLPANLKDPKVRDQSDGSLFYRVSLGFSRHPPLWDTVAVNDRWAIINYLRSLAGHEKS